MRKFANELAREHGSDQLQKIAPEMLSHSASTNLRYYSGLTKGRRIGEARVELRAIKTKLSKTMKKGWSPFTI
jgi:hypothetical protein